MPVAIRAITRIQDADDANLTLDAGTDGYAITWDNDAGEFVMAEAGGSSLPVVDETALIYKTGSPAITATFDANSLTAARVYTLPNESMTLAGRGANTFSGAQVITTASASATAMILKDSSLQSAPILQVLRSDNNAMVEISRGGATGSGRLSLYLSGASPVHLECSGESLIIKSTVAAGFRMLPFGNDIYFQNTISSGNIYFTGNSNAQLTGKALFKTNGVEYRYSASNTNAIVDVSILQQRTSGTPAAGFGSAILFQLASSTNNDQSAARLATLWNVATHASRAADLVAYASDYGGDREIWRGRASGTAPQFSVLGATPVARQAHIADPSGGGTQDAEARTAINSILAALESFGFLATS